MGDDSFKKGVTNVAIDDENDDVCKREEEKIEFSKSGIKEILEDKNG